MQYILQIYLFNRRMGKCVWFVKTKWRIEYGSYIRLKNDLIKDQIRGSLTVQYNNPRRNKKLCCIFFYLSFQSTFIPILWVEFVHICIFFQCNPVQLATLTSNCLIHWLCNIVQSARRGQCCHESEKLRRAYTGIDFRLSWIPRNTSRKCNWNSGKVSTPMWQLSRIKTR